MFFPPSGRGKNRACPLSWKPDSPPYKNNPPRGRLPQTNPSSQRIKNKASHTLMMIGRFVSSPAGETKTRRATPSPDPKGDKYAQNAAKKPPPASAEPALQKKEAPNPRENPNKPPPGDKQQGKAHTLPKPDSY